MKFNVYCLCTGRVLNGTFCVLYILLLSLKILSKLQIMFSLFCRTIKKNVLILSLLLFILKRDKK